MIELSTEERALLNALATSGRPLGSYEVRTMVLPSTPKGDGRNREHRMWREQSNNLIDAWLDLWNAGLITEVVKADGEYGSKCAITDAGRTALAAIAETEG